MDCPYYSYLDRYAEDRYAEDRFAEDRYAEVRFAEELTNAYSKLHARGGSGHDYNPDHESRYAPADRFQSR